MADTIETRGIFLEDIVAPSHSSCDRLKSASSLPVVMQVDNGLFRIHIEVLEVDHGKLGGERWGA